MTHHYRIFTLRDQAGNTLASGAACAALTDAQRWDVVNDFRTLK